MAESETDRTQRAEPPSAGDDFAAMLRGDQRLRWQQGTRVPVEAYFEHYPELRTRPTALRELVLGEIHLRREMGDSLDLSDFIRRFPDYAPWLREQFAHLRPPAADSDTSEADDRDDTDTPWPVLPGYEIVEEIGRGGMGVVYKARQTRLNRFVALKVLLAGSHAGPKTRARFRAEADVVARLQHANIAQIYDILEQDDQVYLALEYVGGDSLAKRISGRPQPVDWSIRLIKDLADAVEYAHARGIVHRDLKPGNILLTEDGVPKIVDFGLAKRLDAETSTTKTGTVLGTPDYMAPEQADGRVHEIGPATDVYALGAILYELLAGRPPFRAEAIVRVLDAVRFQKPAPPRAGRPEVSRDLETVCLKCLEKEPAKRYASAAGLAADLGRVLAGEPIRVGAASRLQRLRDWFRRRT
jgi:serine/threonine protein kinase